MKNNRLMMFITLALIACMAIAGTALAGPKSLKPSTTCSTELASCPTSTCSTSSTTTSSTCPTTSTTRCTCPTTTSTTCPATTSTTKCTCPTTSTTRPVCSTTTTVKPAAVKYGGNGKPTQAEKNAKSASKKFGSIAGTTVLDTTDTAGKAITKPLRGVHLRLLNSKGKVVRATLSDRNGAFAFKNVKPNPDNELYTITAKSKRYTPVNMLIIKVDVNKGTTTNIGEIRFKP